MRMPKPIREFTQAEFGKFFSRVEMKRAPGCWLFGNKPSFKESYPSFMGYAAHRAIWRMLNGKIPNGLVVDHLCENRHCVNIQHLEPVTHQENVSRSRRGRSEPTPLQVELMKIGARYYRARSKAIARHAAIAKTQEAQ